MNFSINAGDFSRALKIALTAVGSGSSLPIVGHVLLTAYANDQRLRLTGTNIEWWAEATAPLVELLEPGAITLPARKLAALVDSFPADTVLDVVHEDGGNKVRIEAGFNQSQMLGLPAEEFPLPPDLDGQQTEFAIAPEVLTSMVGGASYAVARDDHKKSLTNVVFAVRPPYIRDRRDDSILLLTATDQHRLVCREVAIRQIEPGDGQWLVPAAVAINLVRLVGKDNSDLLFAFSPNFVRVQSATGTFTARLFIDTYPNWERVVPQSFDGNFVVERAALIAAIKRIHLFSSDDGSKIVFDVDGCQLTVSGESGTVGQAKETLEIAREGDAILTAFNGAYLLDALQGETSEGVRFDYTQPLRPAKVTASGDDEKNGILGLQVLMPMQVN